MKIKVLNRKNLVSLIVIAISICNFTKANAQIEARYGVMTFNKAINISEKQGMLFQRIVKDYLYMVKNPGDVKVSRDFLTSKIIFEKQNEILFENSKSKFTKGKIQKVKNLWSDFKKLLANNPNLNDAKKIVDQNTNLLTATERVVSFITLEAKNANKNSVKGLDDNYLEKDGELKKILTICGRQRMLTQRLALYYLANHGALIKGKDSEQMLKNIYNEMDGINTPLLVSDFDSDEIDQKIAEALILWDSIKKDKLHKLEYGNKELYDLTNKLTKAYNAITSLYEHTKL